MIGSRYVIEHCIAAFLDKQKRENRELTCQLYDSKCLEITTENIAFIANCLKPKNCDFEIKTITSGLSETLNNLKDPRSKKEEKELDPEEVIESIRKKLRGD